MHCIAVLSYGRLCMPVEMVPYLQMPDSTKIHKIKAKFPAIYDVTEFYKLAKFINLRPPDVAPHIREMYSYCGGVCVRVL